MIVKYRLILVATILSFILSACARTPAPAAGATAKPSSPTATPLLPTATPLPTPTPRPGADKQGGTLIMGFYQEPDVLNPYIRTQTVAGIAADFMERGLIMSLPDGQRVPDLAAEVPTVQNGGVSPDGLMITYTLKSEIVWSDGDPFDCQDVLFTWQAIMHPESGATSTSGYKEMESVTCPDAHTVVVKYKTFYAPYLTRFPSILPAHVGLDPAQMKEWPYNRKPEPVLGPFKLAEWVAGDHMTLVRNERYERWPTEGKPYLDSIVLRWIESREVGKQLIQTGEIDFLWDLTEADIPEAQGWSGIVLDTPLETGTERLVLNLVNPELDAPCLEYLQENPSPHWALGDARVREAIELGIDKQKLVDKLLYGLATPGTTELNLGWAKSNIPLSPYDPERAKALLQEAGWIDTDGDGVRECRGCATAETGRVLRLKFQTTSGNALREQVQQVIMEMMAEIGIQLYIENVPSAELFGSYASGAARKHGRFDILMYTTTYGIDPHSHMEGYYASYNIPCDANNGRGYNYSRWIDPEADRWLKVAGSTPDEQTRVQAYQKVAERIAIGRPQIYLYDRMDINAHVEALKGWQNNIWETIAWNAEEWWLDR